MGAHTTHKANYKPVVTHDDGKVTVIPARVPQLGLIEVEGAKNKSSAKSNQFCSRIVVHYLSNRGAMEVKDVVRRLKVDYDEDKRMMSLLKEFGLSVPDLTVSECKFCKHKKTKKLQVNLTSWASFATGPEMRIVRKPKRPLIVPHPIVKRVIKKPVKRIST